MLKLKLQYFGHLMQRTDSLEKTLMLGRLKAGWEGDHKGWDGWMASPSWWTWAWISSRSWWWTGKPGVLKSMGLQRVEHDWATELNWTGEGTEAQEAWVAGPGLQSSEQAEPGLKFLQSDPPNCDSHVAISMTLCSLWMAEREHKEGWALVTLRSLGSRTELRQVSLQTVPGLSCSRLFVVACELLLVVCGFYFPDQGWNMAPGTGSRVLAAGSPVCVQLCLTLCDHVDCSPPDSSVHGIFQARILEWVAMPFSRGSSQPRDRT